MDFSFGEQIKIILKRNHMTIQDLANLYESQTGVKMTRQNLSQRLRRDNFPEQDMHLIAAMLGYQVSVSLTPLTNATQETAPVQPIRQNISRPATLPKASKPQKVTTADGSTMQIPDLFVVGYGLDFAQKYRNLPYIGVIEQ